MTETFFSDLKGHRDFNQLCNPDEYLPAPSNWALVITDVIQSTKAIEAGRYKEVNMIGAATLAALDHAIGHLSFPFVFGGDGASALIPVQYLDPVNRELCGLRRLAREAFELELRVGVIPMDELEREAGPLYVGKYLLANDVPMALFRGGALAKADELIKARGDLYEVPELGSPWTDLSNLSCRWKPLEASRDQILSVLACQPVWDGAALKKLLSDLDRIMAPNMEDANPVKVEEMKFEGWTSLIRADSRAQRKWGRRIARYWETTLAYVLFRLGLDGYMKNVLNYRNATPAHSDFRKYDDALRMVLDCTDEQAEQIKGLLQKTREETGLCYGTHSSSSALMTCYVPSIDDGCHIHFIDGGAGGYAMAAVELKKQLAQESMSS